MRKDLNRLQYEQCKKHLPLTAQDLITFVVNNAATFNINNTELNSVFGEQRSNL